MSNETKTPSAEEYFDKKYWGGKIKGLSETDKKVRNFCITAMQEYAELYAKPPQGIPTDKEISTIVKAAMFETNIGEYIGIRTAKKIRESYLIPLAKENETLLKENEEMKTRMKELEVENESRRI